MHPNENLTIDDIARALGVSKTTVSRAISGKGRISAATRSKVLDYIEIHNYIPNAAAKGLAERRTYNLALVLPHSFLGLDLPFLRQSMSAICQEAFLFDYNVMVCLSTGQESDPLVRTLDHRKVDGVILTRTAEHDPITELLIDREIPFATLGTLPHSYRGKATVEADHLQTEGCRAFSKVFLSQSSEKNALLGNDLGYVVNQSRLTGFTEARKELGLPLERTSVRVGLDSQDAVSAAVADLLRQGIHRFLCMDDELCIQTLVALSSMGLTIPMDAEVASLCDSPMLRSHVPPISAVEFDAAELGRTACRELLHSLRNESFAPAPRLGYEIHMR